MSRLRIALLSLVAVFAVNMFVAAVASAEGPFWHVGGEKLKQGSKGIKLQSKGELILKGELSSKPTNIKVVITCLNSTSNGTIDGQGPTKQGQDKGTVTYTQCSVVTEPEFKGCTVVEPITTNQLKSHLAEAVVQQKMQIVDLFEPSPNPQLEQKGETPSFVTIHLTKCGLAEGLWPVKGSVVAQLAPQEEEGQEGSLYFPKEPILKINHEGQQEVKVGLTFNGLPATFTGFYGARLQSGEKWGVFRQ